MEQKQTKLLVAELRVIALTLRSRYCRDILNQAADRLEDTDKIAQFYHKELEKMPKPLVITKLKKGDKGYKKWEG